MKSLQHNRPLTIAITFSVLAHVSLLAVRFAAPDAFRLQPADPGLTIVRFGIPRQQTP